MNAFPTISVFQKGKTEVLNSNVSQGDVNSVQCTQLMQTLGSFFLSLHHLWEAPKANPEL